MSEKSENYTPTAEELRLIALVNDTRNTVEVNEDGTSDLEFIKSELSKPENALLRGSDGFSNAWRLAHYGLISEKQAGNFCAAEYQLWSETVLKVKCDLIC